MINPVKIAFAGILFFLAAFSQAQLNSEVQNGQITLIKKGETPQQKYVNLTTNDINFLGACELGELKFVKEYDSLGVNLNVYNSLGTTGLIVSSENGKTPVVKYLLSKNVNVNAQNIYGYTALILAADRGHTEVVKLLIEKGANLNIEAESGGVTALLRAVINNNYPMAEILLKAGANPNIKTGNPVTPTILKNAWDKPMKKLLKEYKAK